jgi:hypothetical protein
VARLQELTWTKAAPDPNALACDGLLVRRVQPPVEPLPRRCVAGRPVRAVTLDVLGWCGARLAAPGMTALLLIGDHASWHTRQAVRSWSRPHHQWVHRHQRGVRSIAGGRPVTSPWLHPLEPKGVHGTRAVSEPQRLLSAAELEARVCLY